MASPYSLLTRIRARVATWLEPYPDKGEAWCVNCALNGGRTLVLPSTGHAHHVMQHRGQNGMRSPVAIRVNWGVTPPIIPYSEDED